jgi:UDP-galactopyranose mutase
MVPYILRVKTTFRGRVYSLPVNLHTINQFFGRAMNPAEARAFIERQACKEIVEPKSFEEQALRFLGAPLYEAFFKGFTRKQWGTEPSALPASILKRLPVRFDYNDNYFDHPYQAIPRDGYTEIVRNILSHRKIELRLNCRFEDLTERFGYVFYSGGMDRYYRYAMGRLGYRTLDFECSYHEGDYQGTALMNYPEESVPYTRVTEHKYLAPWEAADANGTIVFHEASRSCGPGDIPYYPIRLVEEMALLKAYEERARHETDVSFVGRLGTYRYLDMDMTIDHALTEARNFLSWRLAKLSA